VSGGDKVIQKILTDAITGSLRKDSRRHISLARLRGAGRRPREDEEGWKPISDTLSIANGAFEFVSGDEHAWPWEQVRKVDMVLIGNMTFATYR
jgi:hypothetical protein